MIYCCSNKINSFKINKNVTNNISVIPPSNISVVKADSGASSHAFAAKDKHCLENIRPLYNGPTCKLPNGQTITPKETGIIPNIPELNEEAKQAHIHPMIKNSSLLSIGQLCDDGCSAIFTKEKLQVIKNNKIIMTGKRNAEDGLWDVPVKKQKESTINAIIRKDSTKTKLANYYHACLGSPCLTTLQKAVRQGNLITWPGIEGINFLKYKPNEVATALGHMDLEKQGLQSTKSNDSDFFPDTELKTKNTFAQVLPFNEKEMTYSDQTGKFPYRSTRGNEYIMIMYNYDSNAIVAEAVKNRQAKELVQAWEKLFQSINKNNNVTNLFILDNECSGEMKAALNKYKLQFQLVPPDNHRRNAAERAIRTFKSHFLSCLATCPKEFPIREWDRLIPQAVLTLNLLRTARTNTNLSAHAYLNGIHDFTKCPLAPFGNKVMIHQKPKNRA